MKRWHLYVVLCSDETLYTGIAIDVERRVAQHNAGKGAKYTRGRGPVRLVYRRSFVTLREAMQAEIAFKRLPRWQKILRASVVLPK